MKKIVLLVVSILIVYSTEAQDRHYWMNMGGSRSALLGGIVVGSVRDNSAGYYNPAGLAYINKNSHSVSSDAYQLQNIIINNGVGTNLDLNSNQVQLIPTMASGTFQTDLIPGFRLGYVIAARDFTTIQSSARYETVADVIPSIENAVYLGNNQFVNAFEGKEDYSGQYSLDVNLNEIWGGVSWATFLTDNIAFGITWFVAFRNHSQTENTNVFAADGNTLKVASNQILETIEYWEVSTFPKIGFTYSLENFRVGLTVTSPNIHVLGQGTIASILTSRNIFTLDDPEDNIPLLIEVVGTDRQQDLKAVHKNPLSFALGLELNPWKNISINAGCEYFDGVDKYVMIQPKDKRFFKANFDEELEEINSAKILRVEDVKKAVLNYGVGIEYKFNSDIKTYASIRTNYKNNKSFNSTGLTIGFSDWNIYHATIGAIYKFDEQEIALAFTGSYGKNSNFSQLANFTDPSPLVNDIFITGQPKNTVAKYWELGVMLGFTYYLSN